MPGRFFFAALSLKWRRQRQQIIANEPAQCPLNRLRKPLDQGPVTGLTTSLGLGQTEWVVALTACRQVSGLFSSQSITSSSSLISAPKCQLLTLSYPFPQSLPSASLNCLAWRLWAYSCRCLEGIDFEVRVKVTQIWPPCD